jgi:hypothetical protein
MELPNLSENEPKPIRKTWHTPMCTRKSWQTPQLVHIPFGETRTGTFTTHHEVSSGSNVAS